MRVCLPENRSTRRLAAAVGLVCCALLLGFAWGDDQGSAILSRSLYAAYKTDFSGVRQVDVYQKGTLVKSYRQNVFHKRGNKQRISVVGGGQMVVSNGQKMWEYYPDTQKVVVRDLPDPQQDLKNKLQTLRQMASRMTLQYEGPQTVAQRAVSVVKVIGPRGRLIKRVWVDDERGIELASERYDRDGNISFSTYYSRVNFAPKFPDGCFDFTVPEGAHVENAPAPRQRLTFAQAQQAAGFAGVYPGYIPSGYTFDADGVSVVERHGHKALWLTFSNGVDSFSLFESGLPVKMPQSVPHKVTVWTSGPYLFILVGRLPDSEIDQIRASLQPR